MKKFINGISYLLAIVLIFVIIKWEDVKNAIGNVYSEDTGFLSFVLGLPQVILTTILEYFANWDGWTRITSIILLTFLLIVFASLDLFAKNKIDKIKSFYFQWMKSDWFSHFIKLGVAFFILIFLVISANIVVKFIGVTNSLTVEEVDSKQPVIVLGTSKYLDDEKQNINLYYKYRIDKALELYHADKASMFVVSGDRTVNDSTYYNEPQMMEDDLIAGGVPPNMIKKDSAGYRTLDSILRIRSLFKLKQFLIVSQQFHTERALVLSYFYGTEGKAVEAEGSATAGMIKREALARVKAILDVLVFNMQPKVGSDEYQYRQAFSVNNKASSWLVFILAIAFITVIWVMFSLLENRTEGVGKKLKIAMVSLTASVVLTISAYKNLDIESLDNAVRGISESTGLFEASVKKKEKRQEIVKKEKIEIAKAVIERGEEDEKDVIEDLDIDEEEFSAMINEDLNIDDMDIQLEEDSAAFSDDENMDGPEYYTTRKEGERAGFNSQSFSENRAKVNTSSNEANTSKAVEEKSEEKPVEEKPKKAGFGTSSGFGNSRTQSSLSKGSSKPSISYGETSQNINAVVYGSHEISSGQVLRMRLRQAAIINDVNFPRNTIFTAKAVIEGKRLLVSIDEMLSPNRKSVPTNLEVYDLDGLRGIRLNISDDQLAKMEEHKNRKDEDKKEGIVSFNGLSNKEFSVNVSSNHEIILKQK